MSQELKEGEVKVKVRTIDANRFSSGGAAPEVDEHTGKPKQLQAFVITDDPEVLLIPQFLSDAEIEHMLGLAEDLWAPSGVQVGQSKEKAYSEARTSYSCILQPEHTDMIASIEQNVSSLAGISMDYLEQLALVRYEPGQFFTTHHDGAQRSKTVFIYLNDLPDDAEGCTVFPELKVQFIPRKGCAVMWNNVLEDGSQDWRLAHTGMPPTKGVKYGVNCFFNAKPLKMRGVIGGDTPVEVPLVNTEAQDRKEWATIDPMELLREGPLDQIQSNVFNADPKLAVLPNCVSADEAAAMIRFHERPSNESVPEQELQLLATVQARIASIVGEELRNMKKFHIAKYRPGMVPEGLSKTGDGEYCDKFGSKNVFIYLGEVEDGGAELRFPRLGFQVRPRTGAAISWSTLDASGKQCLTTAHQPNELNGGGILFIALMTFK